MDESPLWLLKKGKTEEALKIIERMVRINNMYSGQQKTTQSLLIDHNTLEMPAVEKAPTTLEFLKNKSVRTNFLINTQLFIAVSVSYYIMNF